MPRLEHESGAWFELPEDLSWGQLDTYEQTAAATLEGVRGTDSQLARAAIEGGLAAGFVKVGEGVPANKEALKDFASARVMYWMASEIAKFIKHIKTVDPKSSGRRR